MSEPVKEETQGRALPTWLQLSEETHPLAWSCTTSPIQAVENEHVLQEQSFGEKKKKSIFSFLSPFSGWSSLSLGHYVLCCPDSGSQPLPVAAGHPESTANSECIVGV